jgi:site-specific DNA recombinase
MTAVIYTRVSSREQEQEGFSLGAQAKLLREYAEGNGIHIVKAFEDVETAKASGRKQFSDMVTWFKQNQSCRILLVEKTDRLYRNFRDAVTLEDLDIEIHFVKEGSALSKDSKSQTRLIHGIHLVMARNYSENLREEVKKGMHEKALLGVYPGHAPFGYRNNKADRTIDIDPVDSLTVSRIFALYATGKHSISTLVQTVHAETGKKMSRNNMHLILKNRFYTGHFKWGGQTYSGSHPLFLDPALFERVQSILASPHRPDYLKRTIAFRGLMQCGYDGCMITGEIHKEKYVYYRCTGNRGKCDLPWFRENDIAERLGEPLKGLQMPLELVSRIVSSLREDPQNAAGTINAARLRLESRLTCLRDRMDQSYTDKLDGKIPEDFWARNMKDWLKEEQQIKTAIKKLDNRNVKDRAVSAERTFDLANKAYSLYLSQSSTDRGRLLKLLFSNCSVDADHVTPTFREPFDMIFKKASLEEWSQYLWELAPPISATLQ